MKTRIKSIFVRVLVYAVVAVLTVGITTIFYTRWYVDKIYAPLKTEWNEQVGVVVKDLSYQEGQFHDYDLYLPAEKQAHALILFIHGGSFTAGDKGDEDLWCKFFTSKGYISATANYTLGGEGRETNLNMMYDELLTCVASIKQECEERGYRLDGMATSGQSAGGCLAMLYAYRAGNESPIPVKLVFQQTGPADFSPEGWNITDDEGKAAFVQMMTGETVTIGDVRSGKYLEIAAQISPASLVDNTSVPTISAYGPSDKIVPVGLKFKLFERLNQCGATHEYIEYPHSGHLLAGDPDKQAEFVQKSLQYCEKYLK